MPGQLTIACKIPSGYVLQVFKMEDRDEPMFGGGVKTVKRAIQVGESVKLNGCARRMGVDTEHDIRGGAGLTYGVDADLYARWLDVMKDEPIVKNGLIFAQPTSKPEDIKAQIKAHGEQKSGMEPLDQSNLPPEFRGRIQFTTAA